MKAQTTSEREQPVTWIYITSNLLLGGGDQILLAHARALRSTRHRIVLFSLQSFTEKDSFAGALRELEVDVFQAPTVWRVVAPCLARMLVPALIAKVGLALMASVAQVARQSLSISRRNHRRMSEARLQLRQMRKEFREVFRNTADKIEERLFHWATFFLLSRRLQKPDVAGVHIFHAGACATIGSWATRYSQPFLYTEILTPNSYGSRFPQLGEVLSTFDEIIVPANTIARHLKEIYGLTNHFRVIPFTVPIETTPEALQFHPDRLHYGVLARLSEEKGHQFLLQAAIDVERQYPQAHLLLAGDGVLESTLRRQMESLSLADKVTFLGRYFPDDLAGIMAQIDVVVLPSLTEGMPHVLVEAMAFGKPIVATAVGAVEEMVADGENGFVVPPRDVEALREKITFLFSNSALRKNMGERSRTFFEQRYEYSAVLDKIRALCDDWANRDVEKSL